MPFHCWPTTCIRILLYYLGMELRDCQTSHVCVIHTPSYSNRLFFFFCFGRFGAGEQNGFFSLSKMALERMREKISEYSGTLIQ